MRYEHSMSSKVRHDFSSRELKKSESSIVPRTRGNSDIFNTLDFVIHLKKVNVLYMMHRSLIPSLKCPTCSNHIRYDVYEAMKPYRVWEWYYAMQ